MVSSSSATALASESEKRRKQTMERAKAVHLSRQLQMRLQYARLKVEYGWQKQNLNEVENLYFHHSHLRGPKPFPAPSVIATHQHATSFVGPSTSPVQSSLSFKLAASSLGRNSSHASSLQVYDQSKNHTFNEDANTAANPAQQSFPINEYSISLNIDSSQRLTTSGFTEVDAEDAEVTPSLPTPLGQTGANQDKPLEDQIATIGLPSPVGNSKSPVDPTPPLMNPHLIVKSQRGRSQKLHTVPKAPPTLSTRDMFNLSSTSNLTYDSFWSSHTGTTTPQSSRGSHGDIVTDYPLTFQSPGSDVNNGIATISQPNSDRQRNFGVPA